LPKIHKALFCVNDFFRRDKKIKFTTVQTRKRAVFEPGTGILQKKTGVFQGVRREGGIPPGTLVEGAPGMAGNGQGKRGGPVIIPVLVRDRLPQNSKPTRVRP
jgi:hypothetical protein